ncbi:MAG: septal ring lytic transglycosylase RlpA family protein [Stenotrophobium sp.]
MNGRHARLLLVLPALVALAACGSLPPRQPSGTNAGVVPLDKDMPPSPDEIPPNIDKTPDVVPVPEAKSASGNPSSYEVFGKTYSVMNDADGFHQRGYASWYGKKFHGRRTASGERYNMFAMTAAHKTLPLPTFVRVTNLQNRKTAVVKVNDRGPFHSDRIIDLSYAAAARLGLIGGGTAMVEIDSIDPGKPPLPPAAVATATMSAEPDPAPAAASSAPAPAPSFKASPAPGGYLQVAAFIDPINAVALREDLLNRGVTAVEIRSSGNEDPPLHRVLVGPFVDENAAHDTRELLGANGLKSEWIPQ